MNLTIRPAEDADYDALAELNNLVYPHELVSADELRYDDATIKAPLQILRLVALEGGVLRGTASYMQYPGSYHPGQYYLDVQVFPDQRRRGIGGALYQALLARLAPHRPERYSIYVREDDPLLDHVVGLGYIEKMREWQAHLDPSTVDLTPYDGLLAKLAAEGVRIVSYADLPTADRDRRLYEVFRVVRRDVPRTIPATDYSYEDFQVHVLGSPYFHPEGALLAEAAGRLVGMSQFWKSSAGEGLYIGTTGVLRDWRRRGIALALKVEGTRFAAAEGAPVIHTSNATSNVGMIAINDRLGYAREVAWVALELDLEGIP